MTRPLRGRSGGRDALVRPVSPSHRRWYHGGGTAARRASRGTRGRPARPSRCRGTSAAPRRRPSSDGSDRRRPRPIVARSSGSRTDRAPATRHGGARDSRAAGLPEGSRGRGADRRGDPGACRCRPRGSAARPCPAVRRGRAVRGPEARRLPGHRRAAPPRRSRFQVQSATPTGGAASPAAPGVAARGTVPGPVPDPRRGRRDGGGRGGRGAPCTIWATGPSSPGLKMRMDTLTFPNPPGDAGDGRARTAGTSEASASSSGAAAPAGTWRMPSATTSRAGSSGTPSVTTASRTTGGPASSTAGPGTESGAGATGSCATVASCGTGASGAGDATGSSGAPSTSGTTGSSGGTAPPCDIEATASCGVTSAPGATGSSGATGSVGSAGSSDTTGVTDGSPGRGAAASTARLARGARGRRATARVATPASAAPAARSGVRTPADFLTHQSARAVDFQGDIAAATWPHVAPPAPARARPPTASAPSPPRRAQRHRARDTALISPVGAESAHRRARLRGPPRRRTRRVPWPGPGWQASVRGASSDHFDPSPSSTTRSPVMSHQCLRPLIFGETLRGCTQRPRSGASSSSSPTCRSCVRWPAASRCAGAARRSDPGRLRRPDPRRRPLRRQPRPRLRGVRGGHDHRRDPPPPARPLERGARADARGRAARADLPGARRVRGAHRPHADDDRARPGGRRAAGRRGRSARAGSRADPRRRRCAGGRSDHQAPGDARPARGDPHPSPRERRIVVLSFYGERSQRRVADDVGLSQIHVSRLLRSALARLRVALEDDAPVAHCAEDA